MQLRGQNVVNVVLTAVLLLHQLRHVKKLLLDNSHSLLHLDAVEINELFNVVVFVDLIEHLPSDIPVNFLSSFLVLLWGHSLSSSILIPSRGFILHVNILVHLDSNVLVFVLNVFVSLHEERLFILGTHVLFAIPSSALHHRLH
jgi:hypothetical protein